MVRAETPPHLWQQVALCQCPQPPAVRLPLLLHLEALRGGTAGTVHPPQPRARHLDAQAAALLGGAGAAGGGGEGVAREQGEGQQGKGGREASMGQLPWGEARAAAVLVVMLRARLQEGQVGQADPGEHVGHYYERRRTECTSWVK